MKCVTSVILIMEKKRISRNADKNWLKEIERYSKKKYFLI